MVTPERNQKPPAVKACLNQISFIINKISKPGKYKLFFDGPQSSLLLILYLICEK
jgi:hypothetical protein